MQLKMPPSKTLQVKNLILVNEMRDNNGKINLYFGRCETEVIGERHMIGNSLKTKVSSLSLW